VGDPAAGYNNPVALIRFLKMHGCGNDFIVFDDVDDRFSWHDLGELARNYCRRRYGIGADGIISVGRPPGKDADFEMRYVNADGTRAEMCGNGIRCLGKFVADELGWSKGSAKVLTGAGVLPITIHSHNDSVDSVTVSMGVPGITAGEVPTTLRPSDQQVAGVVLDIDDERLAITAVNMGNPHAVSFVSSITDHMVLSTGPELENHPVFPKGVNAEFVRVLDRNKLRMRVWERGCGETEACGTGACASVVAAVMNGHCDHASEVTVRLNGGDLRITWPAPNQPVLMTGPAVTVFSGELAV